MDSGSFLGREVSFGSLSLSARDFRGFTLNVVRKIANRSQIAFGSKTREQGHFMDNLLLRIIELTGFNHFPEYKSSKHEVGV